MNENQTLFDHLASAAAQAAPFLTTKACESIAQAAQSALPAVEDAVVKAIGPRAVDRQIVVLLASAATVAAAAIHLGLTRHFRCGRETHDCHIREAVLRAVIERLGNTESEKTITTVIEVLRKACSLNTNALGATSALHEGDATEQDVDRACLAAWDAQWKVDSVVEDMWNAATEKAGLFGLTSDPLNVLSDADAEERKAEEEAQAALPLIPF